MEGRKTNKKGYQKTKAYAQQQPKSSSKSEMDPRMNIEPTYSSSVGYPVCF